MYNQQNPYQPTQQNYGSYQQQPYQMNRPIYQNTAPAPYQGLKGRPVASIDEARASMIDFDGSVFFFPDLANKRIYTKQIALDGTASLNMYELREIPVQTPVATINESNFITREEFDNTVAQLKAYLAQSAPKAEETKQAQTLNF